MRTISPLSGGSRGTAPCCSRFALRIPQKSRKSPARSLNVVFPPIASPPLFFHIQITTDSTRLCLPGRGMEAPGRIEWNHKQARKRARARAGLIFTERPALCARRFSRTPAVPPLHILSIACNIWQYFMAN